MIEMYIHRTFTLMCLTVLRKFIEALQKQVTDLGGTRWEAASIYFLRLEIRTYGILSFCPVVVDTI